MEFTIEAFLEAKRIGSPYTGSGRSEATIATYRRTLTKIERLAGKPIADFTNADLPTFLQGMEDEHLADNTRNLLINSGKQAFEWAIGNDLHTGKNPFKAVPRRKVEREIKDVLSPEQIRRLIDAMDDAEREKFEKISADSAVTRTSWYKAGPTGKWALMTKIMAFGGLRIGEVLKLKKRDVRDDGVRVSTEAGKGGRSRLVPLPSAVVRELREFVAKHPHTDYVFYGESGMAYGIDMGKPMKPQPYYAAFKDALARAGLPSDLTPHILRHSAATRVQEVTGDLTVTQSFLGHANPATTMIYVRIANEKVRKAAAAAFGD